MGVTPPEPMWHIIGQNRATGILDASLKAGRLSHAYLIVGPPHVGKTTLALDVARAVNCIDADGSPPCQQCPQCRRISGGHHADVRLIGLRRLEEGASRRREIPIAEVRSVTNQSHLKPYEGDSRVFIFEDAETMSEEAANALLKTLEEPPPQTLLILLTSQEDRLLPTIKSRCSRIELKPMAEGPLARYLEQERDVEAEQARLLARLSKGCLGWAITALEDPLVMERRATELDRLIGLLGATVEQRFHAASDVASLYYRDREEALETLDIWLSWWRDLLVLREAGPEWVYNRDYSEQLEEWKSAYAPAQIAAFIASIAKTLEALNSNVNARLGLESLMLSLPTPSYIPSP